jgi:hypothetical protein
MVMDPYILSGFHSEKYAEKLQHCESNVDFLEIDHFEVGWTLIMTCTNKTNAIRIGFIIDH